MAKDVRQKQKQATRQKILQEAFAVFAEKGFSVATKDVAAAAGVSHGAVFLHFSTREELVDEVIKQFFEQLNIEIHAAAKESQTIVELLQLHLTIIQEHEAFYSQLISQLATLPPTTQEKLFAYQSTLSLHFDQVLAASRQQQKIVDLPLHLLFNSWLALLHYYLQNKQMFAPQGSVIATCGAELLRAYQKMIYLTDK